MNPLYQTLYNKRYITSCCGKGRQGFIFVNDAAKAKDLHDIHVKITPEECFHLMNTLQQSSTTFRQTGGVLIPRYVIETISSYQEWILEDIMH